MSSTYKNGTKNPILVLRHIDKVCQMGNNYMTSYSWDTPVNRFYYYHAIRTSGIGKFYIYHACEPVDSPDYWPSGSAPRDVSTAHWKNEHMACPGGVYYYHHYHHRAVEGDTTQDLVRGVEFLISTSPETASPILKRVRYLPLTFSLYLCMGYRCKQKKKHIVLPRVEEDCPIEKSYYVRKGF